MENRREEAWELATAAGVKLGAEQEEHPKGTDVHPCRETSWSTGAVLDHNVLSVYGR